MFDIRKWNFESHEYEAYTVPEGTVLVIYSVNMDQFTNCAGCFKDMTFGDGYTSRTLHNSYGIAYPVCSDCYEKECDEERKH